jgi:hypothetical protein
MPKYNYYCEECEEYFEIRHSMKESLDNCALCDCPSPIRVPSIPNYITKINKKNDQKAGSLVEEYIKKNRESVKEEKNRLKSQEYKT